MNMMPFFGVCLGFQVALIELARNIFGWTDANSEEFFKSPCPHHILKFMPEIDRATMGANMRLGSRPVLLQKGSMVWQMYGAGELVYERHRHRYEFNIEHKTAFEDLGVRFSAVDDQGERMEASEFDRAKHPFFFAVQYHPEFKSRPFSPSPPFLTFMVASTSKGEGVQPALDRLQSEGVPSLYPLHPLLEGSVCREFLSNTKKIEKKKAWLVS